MSLRIRNLWMLMMGLVLAGRAVTLSADVINVPADQPAIQAAIAAAAGGDTVLVAPGTYVENLNFLGKAITVTSSQGPLVTVIDGNQSGSVVTFNSGEGPSSSLNGFTIRNGKAGGPALRGGGIRIENASPTITGNIIANNSAGDGGGGISSSFGSPLIQGNTIAGNGQIVGWSGGVGGGGVSVVGASSARLVNNAIVGNSWSNGGGVSLFAAGTPTLEINLISNNSASSQGGGVRLVNQSDALMVQNIIVGNTAGTGGGVSWLVPSGARGPFLINNTISENDSAQGSGVFADGFDGQVQVINNIIVAAVGQNAVVCGSFNASVPVFQFNDVIAPSGSAFAGDCTNQTGINGNISADPLFRNPANGDYHLQTGSPAIDSGTSTLAPPIDPDGVARPSDGNGDGVPVLDIGAYEHPMLDITAPVTTAAATPAANGAGWNLSDVTVSLTAADNAGGSGVESVRYTLAGAQSSPEIVSGNPASVLITEEGITTVGYHATDHAGNIESTGSLTVRIDKTSPAIVGMPAPGCTLSPPRHQLVLVATVTAQDSFSGVAALDVTATSSEPDSGTGGGDLPGDIVIAGGSIQLRAELSPGSKTRTYTITATATDFAGNVATAAATCKVTK